jgi:hypothetical protein
MCETNVMVQVSLRDTVTVRRRIPWAEAARLPVGYRYAMRSGSGCGLAAFDRTRRARAPFARFQRDRVACWIGFS